MTPKASHSQYNRLKYYNSIRTHRAQEEGAHYDDSFLDAPDNIIPSEYFIINFGFKKPEAGQKHGSLTTIFSTWNAMAGTGIVSMPYAY